jgi:hypothetical protein
VACRHSRAELTSIESAPGDPNMGAPNSDMLVMSHTGLNLRGCFDAISGNFRVGWGTAMILIFTPRASR